MNNGFKKVQHILREKSQQRHISSKEAYICNPKFCKGCGSVIPYEKRQRNQFCAATCSAIFNNTQRGRKLPSCLNCGTLLSDWCRSYCNHQCRERFHYERFIVLWMAGVTQEHSGIEVSNYIRRWLFTSHESKCQECSWSKVNPSTGKIPLTVDHRDGNPTNHAYGNLRLLCPNCHSLTPTYGALNKGQGRTLRRSRRASPAY